MKWLNEQLESIIKQINVDITIFISDDNSNDGTFDYLCEIAKKNNQIVVLPKTKPFGSSGKNFYRLICDVNFKDFDYIALADQDDIWNIDKLFSHIELLEKSKAAAVSSNVIAFWPDGKEFLIDKSQPQKKYDFLFEGPGPGCSFLMTPELVNKIKYQLKNNPSASRILLHDWLIYAICRAHKKKWIISSQPSLRYRQHSSNVLGANIGLKASLNRFSRIFNGWYRNQVYLVSEVVSKINLDKKFLNFKNTIYFNSILDRLKLIYFAIGGRRKLSERFYLILSILFFIF